MSDGDEVDETTRYTKISRRQAIAAGALGITGTIAGCLGGGGDNDTTTGSGGGTSTEGSGDTTTEGSGDTTTEGSGGTTSTGGGDTSTGTGGSDTSTGSGGDTSTGGSGGTAIDKVYDLAGRHDGIPSNMQYNNYNPKHRVHRRWTWDNLAEIHYGLEDGLFYPSLAKDWKLDNDAGKFTVHLREDSTWWHNDKQITSKDVWTMAMLEYFDREVLYDVTKSFSMPDDKTFVMNLKKTANPALMAQQVLTRHVFPYSTKYGEWADDLSKLLDDKDAWTKYHTDNIANATIETACGSGPFKVTNATRQAFKCEVWDGHWATDAWSSAGSEGARLDYTGANRWTQEVLSDKLDATKQGLTKAEEKKLPDHFKKFAKPNTNGIGLGLNENIEPLGDVRARKALAYIINRKEVASSAGNGKIVPESITGISASQDTYVPKGKVRKQYQTYPVDHDKATKLLKAAGLSKKGGNWKLSDGSTWSPVITTPSSNGGRVQAMNTIAAQLKQFGIDAKLTTVPNSQFWGEKWNNNDFTMFMMWWGGWRPYPLNGLLASLSSGRWDNIGYPGLQKNGGKIDVPMPIGNPDGDKKTINVTDLMSSISGTADSDKNKKTFQKLAWVYNQTLPELPMYYSSATSWMSDDAWNIPEKPSEGEFPNHYKINQPSYSLPKVGLMTPKTK